MDTLTASWPHLTKSQRRFLEIWQEARENDGDIPFRRSLSLSKLRTLAQSMIIGEVVAPGEMRVKISGTNIDGQFGRNLTGCDIRELASPKAATALVRFYEALINQPCGGYARDVLKSKTGRRIDSRYLILPLRDRTGKRNLCASFCDAETDGYDIPTVPEPTKITYQELLDVQMLDLGFGVPDHTYMFKSSED